jgi:hypothetical protein
VLAALGRLRAAEESVYQSVGELVNLARIWLDSDGLVPWPEVEQPVRQAVAALVADVGRLGPDFDAALRGDLGRIIRMLDEGLTELGLSPVSMPEAAVSWSDEALTSAVARVTSASVDPVLSAVEKRLRGHLDALLEPAGAVHEAVEYIAGSRPSSEADELYDQVRGVLLQFLDAYLRPLLRQAAGEAEKALSRAGRTALDDALAGIDEALGQAETDLVRRYVWSDAYARLVALRGAIG